MSNNQSMLAVLESRLLMHNPGDSVHFFPVPTQRRSGEMRKMSFDTTSISSSSGGSSSRSGSPYGHSSASGGGPTGTLKRLGNVWSARSRTR